MNPIQKTATEFNFEKGDLKITKKSQHDNDDNDDNDDDERVSINNSPMSQLS